MLFYNIKIYINNEKLFVFDNLETKLELSKVHSIRIKFYSNVFNRFSFVVYSECGIIEEFEVKLQSNINNNNLVSSCRNISFSKDYIINFFYQELSKNHQSKQQFLWLYYFCKKHKINIKFFMSNEIWKRKQ